jgi:hypothetical protein
MKKAIFGFVFLAAASVVGYLNYDTRHQGVMPFAGWENPETLFDATKNETMDVRIRWVVVGDVDKACNAEQKRRGYPVFRFKVNACSFWQDKECVIYTRKMTNIHTLGHETLHCFRGAYH